MVKRNMFTTERLTYAALLVALQVILGNLTQVPFVEKQFNFGFLPIAVAGAVLGAPWAIIVGGLGDFFGAHLFPQGAYFVGFTITNMLVGLFFALPLYGKKPSWVRVIIATLLVEASYLFVNSLWLSMLYSSKAYWGWVSVRALSYAFEAPVYAILTYLTLKGLQRVKLPEGLSLPADAADNPLPAQADKTADASTTADSEKAEQ